MTNFCKRIIDKLSEKYPDQPWSIEYVDFSYKYLVKTVMDDVHMRKGISIKDVEKYDDEGHMNKLAEILHDCFSRTLMEKKDEQ